MKKTRKLILVFIVLVGIIFQSVPSLMTMVIAATITSDNIKSLRFDDHIDMTGKTVEIIEAGVSADKSAVVELKNNYLIATGIGTAKVRIDGEIHKITVEKAKINLIMIMGQSNAGNHFPNATSDVTCPIGTAYWWGNGNGTSATEPVPYTQSSMGFHTPLLAELYAQSVAAGDPIKNVMIWEEGITSKNGQSIVKWAASAADTSGTDAAVTMLENCRAYYEANSDKYEIVGNGVYWLQGESDTSMNPTLYIERFMAMWQRLKSAGMEYLAFLRVRAINVNSSIKDDLYYTSSLSAQSQMINDNPDFYMATTVTENWIGAASDTHTVDISNYITMMETYGKSDSYTDQYGNNATFSNGKLTTTMKSLYGSNNTCHYGKFGYGIIGADAAYNMYWALRTKDAKIVVADTSGYASRQNVLINGQSTNINVSDMTEDLIFRAECGSTAGTLSVVVQSNNTDITNYEGIVIQSGEHYGAINTSRLSSYKNVSITVTYTTVEGFAHTVICNIQSQSFEQQQDYIWDFNEDLYARGENGEILNSFLSQPLAGTYTLENGYLVGNGLQLELENIIELNGTNNWSIEWKYGSLANGTSGFLLCSNKGNTVGNKALWHTHKGNFAIADYLDSIGYRNYTSTDIKIQDNDCLKLTNTYDPSTGKSTLSLWINGKIAIADLQLKGSINNYHDQLDMTQYPLSGDFSFRYMGNTGMADWFMNCQLDYLKICGSGGHTHTYIATVTVPTCTENGYTTYTCDCGDSYVDDYVDATGHAYENGICTACGAEHPNRANYEGKVISILGDSISTFSGYIPTADGFNLEHLSRYPDASRIPDVTKAEQTWWMQVITELDAKLGINDSWRGAMVSGAAAVTTGSTGPNAAMSNLQRIRNLGANGTPDVILFYGGTNDYAHLSAIGTFDPNTAPVEVDLTTTSWNNLADAYVQTLLRLRYYYPDAVIIAMLPTYTATYYSDTKLSQGNAILAEICAHYGIPCLDLRNSGVTTAHLPDGIHPGAEGMDLIADAVVDLLLSRCNPEAGENVVYSVTHNLYGASASLGYFKGVTHGSVFSESLTGDSLDVTVTMGGKDITAQCYADGKITIASVTGDLVITAKGKFNADGHLQMLPEELCCGTNLWSVLKHDKQYYTVDGWGIHNSGRVYSVTFPVSENDRIYATSFGSKSVNGSGSTNGIRVTYFFEDGSVLSLSANAVYSEFSANGYLTVPAGVLAVSVPMWTVSDSNELYILNRDHVYENGICTSCSAMLGDLNHDGLVNADDLTLLARHVARIESLTGTALANADVNGDGDVNADDLTKHARYVARIITDWDQE